MSNHSGAFHSLPGVTSDGILIVDKPAGITSHDVVARVRKILGTRRVGHTGTLDPFATGVLVVCVNQATRLAQFLTSDEKEYLATMRLGHATDTGDCTGQRITEFQDASHLSEQFFEEALTDFRGHIQQIPPMYSAKKIGGVRLYEMARRGEAIERQPLNAEIRELELLTLTAITDEASGMQFQDAVLRVACSSGTYIRTLAEDIGKQLKIGAHLVALRRTRVGNCHLNQAVTLEELSRRAANETPPNLLIPMNAILDFPEHRLTELELERVSQGSTIAADNSFAASRVKLCDQTGRLVAIAEFDALQKRLQPRIVLSTGG